MFVARTWLFTGMGWEVICDLTNRLNLFQSIMQIYANSLAAFPEEVFLWSLRRGWVRTGMFLM